MVVAVCGAELGPVLMLVAGLRMETWEHVGELAIVPAQSHSLSTEI